MQVKKFEAPTIQEALEHVKRELGPEAIILHTRKNRRGFGLLSKGSVEVTAAVSERSMQKLKQVEIRVPGEKTPTKSYPAEKMADIYDRYMDRNLARAARTEDRVEVRSKDNFLPKKITATRYIDIADDDSSLPPMASSPVRERPLKETSVSTKRAVYGQMLETSLIPPPSQTPELQNKGLEEEVKNLKKSIEELKTQKRAPETDIRLDQTRLDNPVLQESFEQLVVNGIERRSAFSLVKKVAFELGSQRPLQDEIVTDLLAHEIMESLEVIPIFPASGPSNPRIIALVGPTGVGKTTTIAKLAGEAISKRNLKVGLINLDHSKLGAFEQLGIYSKLIGVPFRSAASVEDLKAALLDFKSLDVVLIDTAGRSKRDGSSLQEMEKMLHSIVELKTYLVLSALTKDIELYDAANRFTIFHPQGLILSKLDEAAVFGSIYNLVQKTKLPLAAFTTGQSIPNDIEEATKERVASLLLDLS